MLRLLASAEVSQGLIDRNAREGYDELLLATAGKVCQTVARLDLDTQNSRAG